MRKRTRESGAKKPEHSPRLFLCSWYVVFCALMVWGGDWGLVFADASSPTVLEELSPEEKQTMIQELLREGDQYRIQKSYNLANAAYEEVFTLEPNHPIASRRIDELKKQMLREGKHETQIVEGMYGGEINMRTQQYRAQADAFLKEGKLGQARLTLQKLLLLDPLDDQAQKKYQELSRTLEAQTS